MRISPLAVALTLLISVTVSYGLPKTVDVTGVAECTDCQQNNIQHTHALKGLKVTIDCKLGNGKVKTRGSGEVDEQGKFQVVFPKHLVKDGKLKEECYAQLHGASNTPCPLTHNNNGIESSKIASLSETSSDGKRHRFRPLGKLKFTSATCTSAFLWPHFKKPYTFPPIWKKPCPPIVPVYKKPVYYKPLPQVYYKPLPPPVPVYHKPLPPIFKKKPISIPAFPKKKPCPPFPQLPFPNFPSHPKYKMPSWPKYPPHQ